MLRGVDISSFQGNPNYPEVLSQVDFIICKATEGVGYKDPTFDNNSTQLRNNGKLRGFYHFGRPDLGNTAESEAAWFNQTVSPALDEILVLDFEVNYSDPVTWCKAFLDHLSSLNHGYKPLVYLNLNLIQTHDWTPVINAGYGLWLADYDGIADNTPNTPWPVVAMKQYSSSGQVTGISGNVDMDTFFGDETTFKAYGYHPQVTPVPTTVGNPPIGPDVPVSGDQVKIDLGPALGVLEIQAIRSQLLDDKNKIESLTADFTNDEVTIVRLNNQLTSLKNASNSSSTGTSTPMPQPVPVTPSSGNFLSNLWHRLFG